MTPDRLARLHALAFPQTRGWSAHEFAQLLAQKGVILASTAHSFILLRVAAAEAEVLTLATDPAHQRQGWGQQALQKGELAALAAHAYTICLEVATDNAAAVNLYRTAGYTPVGKRPGYYMPKDRAPISALILRKTLRTP